MRQSPEWHGDQFENPQPMWSDMRDALLHALAGGPDVEPTGQVPYATTDPALLAVAPASGLRVTWFGHSSMLLEMDGARLLTDPIWSDRASPFEWVGPHRWYPPTIALDGCRAIDAVLISHDHYDHLDWATIVAMRAWKNVFIVPLGIGAHLQRWGIPRRTHRRTRLVAVHARGRAHGHAGARASRVRARERDAATSRCGAASRWWATRTASTTRATPACSTRWPRSASASGRSTSR